MAELKKSGKTLYHKINPQPAFGSSWQDFDIEHFVTGMTGMTARLHDCTTA
jgi:hypothetical protein